MGVIATLLRNQYTKLLHGTNFGGIIGTCLLHLLQEWIYARLVRAFFCLFFWGCRK